MKPLRIEANRIVFAAMLDAHDVPTVPAAMYDAAMELTQRISNPVVGIEGNGDEVWFYLSRELTESEAEWLAS